MSGHWEAELAREELYDARLRHAQELVQLREERDELRLAITRAHKRAAAEHTVLLNEIARLKGEATQPDTWVPAGLEPDHQ